jgi:hypothetical protein
MAKAWIAGIGTVGLTGALVLGPVGPAADVVIDGGRPSAAAQAPSGVASLSPPASPVPPAQQPLLEGGDLRFLGTITLPDDDGQGTTLGYGGHALGLSADGQSLYFSCIHGTRLARVSLPDVGGQAALLEPCLGLPNLDALDPTDPNPKRIGGLVAWNGRLVLSGYAVYDAGGIVTKSHWAGTTIATATGPVAVGDELPGLVAGYMGIVPEDWRPLLGGPALTGQCCISVISRTSYGPSVSVFDPDEVGVKKKVSAKMLVGYPRNHETLGDYDRESPYFSSAVLMGGVAFPAGTRSLLFIGRHGSGYCYGEGTNDPTLHGKPTSTGTLWCYDPASADKGAHAFPYRHMVWAYDANDLAAVARGRKAPWDVKPYTSWTLTEMSGGTGNAWINGAVYDHVRRRIYITPRSVPILYVYAVKPGLTGG